MARRTSIVLGFVLSWVPLGASAGDPDPSDDDALSEDILRVLDLPLAAEAAREAGVAVEEVERALLAAQGVGLSAGETAVIVNAETELAKKMGPRRGFDRHMTARLLAGERGEAIAAGLAARKAAVDAMTDAEVAEAKAKYAAVKAEHAAFRTKRLAKRSKLVASGRAIKFLGRAAHQAHRDALKGRQRELLGYHEDPTLTPKYRHEGPGKDAFREPRQDALDARQDARGARKDTLNARKDARDARQGMRDARKGMRGKNPDARGKGKGKGKGRPPKALDDMSRRGRGASEGKGGGR